MTIKVFVIGGMIILFMIFICIFKAILLKKEIYYKYIDTTKKITSFDYFNNFDGDWLFRDIGFEKLLKENSEDQWLIESVKIVRKLERASIFLFLIFMIFGGTMKYLGVV